MMPSPHQLPPGALTCPWCSAPAVPQPVPQQCGGCRRSFTLSAGPALDASVIAPPPHPAARPYKIKWSIVMTYRFATLDPGGVSSGTLDPVIGLAPIDQAGIAFPDVVSIAVWRKLALVDCIVGVLVPVPIALFFAWGAIAVAMKGPGVAAVLGVIAIVFGLIAAMLLRRGFVLGRRQVRIVGRWASFTVPFERAPVFHAELFRRCGIVAPPIP
jgi:hypothetical protein